MTNNKVVPLEALVRRVSRIAEQTFAKDGQIPMIWLVDTPCERRLIVTPIHAEDEDEQAKEEYKDCLDAGLRQHFSEIGMIRYAMAMEVWLWKTDDGIDLHDPYWRDECERDETILIVREDNHQFLWGRREIIRPVHSKPYLGKFEFGRDTENHQCVPCGRFAHFRTKHSIM